MKPNQIVIENDQLIVADGGTLEEMEFAGYCNWYLSQCYPGHPWPVEVQGTPQGFSIRIRHWALTQFGPYCYHISPEDIHTPTSLHYHLKYGGGEILDRLGLPRVGGWDGRIPTHMDDVNAKHRIPI